MTRRRAPVSSVICAGERPCTAASPKISDWRPLLTARGVRKNLHWEKESQCLLAKVCAVPCDPAQMPRTICNIVHINTYHQTRRHTNSHPSQATLSHEYTHGYNTVAPLFNPAHIPIRSSEKAVMCCVCRRSFQGQADTWARIDQVEMSRSRAFRWR